MMYALCTIMQELRFISPDMIFSNEYAFSIPEEDNLDNCRICTYTDMDPDSQLYYLEYDKGEAKIGLKQSRYNLQTLAHIPVPNK